MDFIRDHFSLVTVSIVFTLVSTSNAQIDVEMPDLKLFTQDSVLLLGAEAWGGPIDDADANNTGFVMGLNKGFALFPDRNIGIQLGFTTAIYDLYGRKDGENISDEQKTEQQTFLTVGIFLKNRMNKENPVFNDRLGGALAIDMMFADRIGENSNSSVEVGQIRGEISYAESKERMFGLMFTSGIKGDELPDDHGVSVDALDRIGVFRRTLYDKGGMSEIGVGWANDPNEWYLDLRGYAPLNDTTFLTAGFTYVFASTSGGDNPNQAFAQRIYSARIGLTFLLDKPSGHNGWMPQLPVANNGTFGLSVPEGGI